MAKKKSAYVIGVDVGDIYTEAVVLCDNKVVAAAKSPTEVTPKSSIVKAIGAALGEGLLKELEREAVLENVSRVCIGTNHFMSAVVTRDRDSLALVAVVRLCGSASRAVPPFSSFPSDLRQIICGGIHMAAGGFDFDLSSIAELDERELRKVARDISHRHPFIRNVVVCGVFTPYDNPAGRNQEEKAAEIIMSECPAITCTLSHKIGLLSLIERENGAILNEALKPLAQTTIKAFNSAMEDLGLKCPFYVTRNDCTLVSAEEAVEFPAFTFFLDFTNTVRGAAFLSHLSNALVIDIGPKTTNIGVLKDGFPKEASSNKKVGGVLTNLALPDILGLELGGNSTCLWDSNSRKFTLGPSVDMSEALYTGGSICTMTDTALAAGVAPHSMCQVPISVIDSLNPTMVYKAMTCIRKMIESGIERVKTEEADVPVVLVGGGSVLVDKTVGICGANPLIIPQKHRDVAGAIGAALAGVGTTVDIVESVEGDDDVAQRLLQQMRERAIIEAVMKGAVHSEVKIHSENVVQVGGKVRVSVKAIGPLAVGGEVEDNPYWPFASEEDRQKDLAAGLSCPKVEGGRWLLSEDDVECVAVGASLLGCGGGGDPNMGRLVVLQKLASGKTITVVNPYRLKAADVGLVTFAALMGAPQIVSEKLVSGSENKLAVETMQRLMASGVYDMATRDWEKSGKTGTERVRVKERDAEGGKKVWIANPDDLKEIDILDPTKINQSQRITHIFGAEIGGANSLEPLALAAELDMPVLDADGMGRAFPELQMYSPFIYGSLPYPCTVADSKGEVIACTYVESAKVAEEFFRVECVRMGMVCGMSAGVLTLQEILNKTVLLSQSMAWQLGRAVRRAQINSSNILEAIVAQQNGTILIVGKVTEVAHVTQGGFGRLEAVVEGLDVYKGHKVKIMAKNEYFIVRYVKEGGDGAVMACTPDPICMVNLYTGSPIMSELLKPGMKVGLLALPASPLLLTPRAMAVVGPAAFGLDDVQYHPPCSLQLILQNE